MLTSNYTTLDRILERVNSDYGFVINRYDAAEWLWSIMGKLGIPAALESKYKDDTISDYRTELPIDCYKLENIRDAKTGNLLDKSTDLFFRANKEFLGVADTTTTYFEGPTVVVDARTHDDQASVFVSNVNNASPASMDQLCYQEYNGNIYYGYKTGTVQIFYKAFPVEDDGMPKIPDDPQYIDAVLLGILVKHLIKLHFKGQISSQILDKYERDYAFAAGAAIGKAKMPDLDEMESIKKMMQRLIPIQTNHNSSFRYSNARERLNKM